MKKIMLLMICMFLLLPFGSAEMWFWNDVRLDYDDSIVEKYGYYQFEDTSATGIGRNKPVDVIIWYEVEALPYDLNFYNPNYTGEIDWCNLTISHQKNIYGTSFTFSEGFVSGEYLNTTTEISSYYFSNTSSSSQRITYEMKDRDGLTISMKCHYTDVDYLFVENALIGRWNVLFDAFECNNCEEYSLEELSNQIERQSVINEEGSEIYDKIQLVIDLNYRLWSIASWLIKIAFVIFAIYFIFAGIYNLYLFFRDIERRI